MTEKKEEVKKEKKEKKTVSKAAPGAKKAAVKAVKKQNAEKKSAKAEQSFSTKASVRSVRMSPRKARIVVEMIKGKQVEPALQILRASAKKAGVFTAKLLQSAISNAVQGNSVDADKLWIKNAYVDMGKTLKRYMPRAQGRATPIRKRSAHITIVLGER
jgi:large subunit ribosomal protein L22